MEFPRLGSWEVSTSISAALGQGRGEPQLVDQIRPPVIGPGEESALLAGAERVRKLQVSSLLESIHDDAFQITPPTAYLSVDGSNRHEPTTVKLVSNDIHYRCPKLVFSVPEAPLAALFDRQPHSLNLVVPTGHGQATSTNSFNWQIPLGLPLELASGLGTADVTVQELSFGDTGLNATGSIRSTTVLAGNDSISPPRGQRGGISRRWRH